MTRLPLARIAWRNVRRNWRHSLGSMLSIVVGFVAIALFQGYLGDLEDIQARWNEERGMLGSLVVEREGASSGEGRQDPMAFALSSADQAFVDGFIEERRAEIAARMRVLAVGGLVSAGRASAMFVGWGHDVDEAARMRGDWTWNAVAGRPLHLAEPREAVLLGGRLARLLDCDGPPVTAAVGRGGGFIAAERAFSCPGPRVQLSSATASGQLNAVDLPVAGLFDAGLGELDARFVLMPLPVAQQLLDTDEVSAYHVALVDRGPEAARRFAAAFTDRARTSGLPLVAIPWREHLYGDMYRKGMGVLGIYRALVIFIVVTIAGMSVFTTLVKAVNERVREIGTLRSLGFRRTHIVQLFTLEGALLSIVSSAVGLVVAALAVAAINAAGITYSAGVASQPIPLTVSLLAGTAAAAAAFLVAVAVGAAFLPARRAARLAIPDALGQA